MCRPLENRLPRDIYMKITIIIYTRLFILFPNLITKESYNWWVTRRVWGFRHQIFKEKYPKISQNVGCTYREASGERCGTVQSCCTKCLRNSPSKRYKRIQICVIGEVEMLSSPIRRQNSGCETSGVECRQQQNSGCDTSGWKVGGARM